MKKTKSKEELTKIIKIALVLALILVVINSIINITKNYSEVNLRTNKNDVFTLDDLTVNSLKFGSTEKEVKKELGKPIKEKKILENSLDYKELTYKGIKVRLRENYSDYILVGVEVTSRKYRVGRNIRVGNNIERVMKKYRISHKTGKYLYGNYTLNALKQKEIKDNIYFGLRTKHQVMYISRDVVVDNKTNIAELNIKYDRGRVSNIKWSYDLF